jgi:DNA repair exonuclease SbcCD ATPase subunit
METTNNSGGGTSDANNETKRTCRVEIKNLGGIESLGLEIQSGVSLLAGENATNRTSLLQSIAAALGGEQSAATLKTDSKKGYVSVTLGQEEFTREYTRSPAGVSRSGSPYTDDADIVDTFVSLFADNPARLAVTRGDDLRDLLMQPVDIKEIQHRIQTLQTRRSTLQNEIKEVEKQENELPALTERKRELKEDIESLEGRIEELESEIAEESSDDDEQQDELEALREELTAVESHLEELEQKLQFRRNERSKLEAELADLRDEQDSFQDSNTLAADIERKQQKRDSIRAHIRELRTATEDRQTVIDTNERLLENGLDTFSDTSEVAGALDPRSQSIECLICGTTVERGTVTDRLDTLQTVVADQRTERKETERQLSDIEDELTTLKRKKSRQEEITSRIEEIESQLETHDTRVEELETERERQEAVITELEDDLHALEEKGQSSETDTRDDSLHGKLSAQERERGRVENELDRVTTRIEEIESLREKREQKEDELNSVREELEALRGRIDNRERDLVETLNEMMEDIIDLLGYRNISRVWLERLTDDGGSETSFDLHIVRETADGTVYEDTVDTLSESEREVIGVVVALAGYLVHDLDEVAPFLLFDSIEMIDADRMAALLDYITTNTQAEYLLVALLSKDATALANADKMPGHQRIESFDFN